EESMVTSITPDRLHYLTVPFRLGWQFRPGHIISAGYNISYLFNVEAEVQKYTESINGISDRKSYRADGFTEGFRIFESQAALLYRVKIRKALAFQGEFDLGLTDIKDNVFFNSARFERNVGIKF